MCHISSLLHRAGWEAAETCRAACADSDRMKKKKWAWHLRTRRRIIPIPYSICSLNNARKRTHRGDTQSPGAPFYSASGVRDFRINACCTQSDARIHLGPQMQERSERSRITGRVGRNPRPRCAQIRPHKDNVSIE